MLATSPTRTARRGARTGAWVPHPHPDDLPLRPVIVRWLIAYARAADDERDAVVGAMLTDLNALLHERRTGEREIPSS